MFVSVYVHRDLWSWFVCVESSQCCSNVGIRLFWTTCTQPQSPMACHDTVDGRCVFVCTLGVCSYVESSGSAWTDELLTLCRIHVCVWSRYLERNKVVQETEVRSDMYTYHSPTTRSNVLSFITRADQGVACFAVAASIALAAHIDHGLFGCI